MQVAETQHTPGPWVAEHEAGPATTDGAIASTGVWSQTRYATARESEEGDDPMDSAWICGIWGDLTSEQFANARLIAAAPDLLHSLKEISDMFMARPDMVRAMQPLRGFAENAVFDRAASAIAKAEAR